MVDSSPVASGCVSAGAHDVRRGASELPALRLIRTVPGAGSPAAAARRAGAGTARRPGGINNEHGDRGVYLKDSAGHAIELIIRPYP